MYFTESTYSDRLAEVDVSGDGCGANIEPIWIIGSEFLEGGGFDDIDPGRDFDFACSRLASGDLERTDRIVLGIEHRLGQRREDQRLLHWFLHPWLLLSR
jgi:hypothetical protein